MKMRHLRLKKGLTMRLSVFAMEQGKEVARLGDVESQQEPLLRKLIA